MKRLVSFSLLCVSLSLFTPVTEAGGLSPALMPASQKGRVVYFNKDTGQYRGEFSYTISREPGAQGFIYTSTKKGRGDYAQYTGVTWEARTYFEEQDGLLYPLESSLVIQTTEGRPLARYEEMFNREKGVITFEQFNDTGHRVRLARFPVKGRTTDDLTLLHFLKKFIAERDNPDYRSFYLLSNEPALYKVNIRVLGEETLHLDAGIFQAIKIQLIADLGPATGLMARLFPPTYLWYKKDDPSVWLKYEGLEFGRNSQNIISEAHKMTRPGMSFSPGQSSTLSP